MRREDGTDTGPVHREWCVIIDGQGILTDADGDLIDTGPGLESL